jgi:outer membrane protein assembly factor BamA
MPKRATRTSRSSTSSRSCRPGPKLVHLTFIINQGPKYKIKAVAFDGNTAFSDSALRSQLKENKPKNWYSFLTSSGHVPRSEVR